MAKSRRSPNSKKIGPEDVDEIFDKRADIGDIGFPTLTAGKIAEVIVAESEELEDLNPETVRNHLNDMVDSDEYDVAKYKLGPRTVVYGRKDDAKLVVESGPHPSNRGKLVTYLGKLFGWIIPTFKASG